MNANATAKIEGRTSHCGRLIVMGKGFDNSKPLSPPNLKNMFSIEFPSMPETIELARAADYKVISNIVIPDGVHQYKGTAPLSIPFSFALHSMDRVYCPFGAYTLLQVAARMHALVLPFGNSEDTSVSVSEKADLLYGTDNPGGEAAGETVAKGQQSKGKNKPSGVEKKVEVNAKEPENMAFSALDGANFDPPVTCRLELMFTADADPGIVCTGYIKEVSVKLKGPWLKGPDQSFNLPTWGEFSFVFVHRPGHFNSYAGKKGAASTTQQAQAYNEYVLERFYNTRSLSTTGDYRGFGDAAEVTPTPIVWQGPPAPTAEEARKAQIIATRVQAPASQSAGPFGGDFAAFKWEWWK